MAKNLVASGDIIPFTNGGTALAAGDGFKFGSMILVALAAYAANATNCQGAVSGVYEVKKTSAQAWTAGAAIFWDDSAKEFTNNSNSGANAKAGAAYEAAANPSAKGKVRLFPI